MKTAYELGMKAKATLAPLYEIIKDGSIIPNNGCVSYLYGVALIRYNEADRALTELMIAAASLQRELNNDTRRTVPQHEGAVTLPQEGEGVHAVRDGVHGPSRSRDEHY